MRTTSFFKFTCCFFAVLVSFLALSSSVSATIADQQHQISADTISADSVAKLPEFSVAWSIYAGWMPYGYMEHSGILQKWERIMGVNIYTEMLTYLGSLEGVTLAGNAIGGGRVFDACVMTNMDQIITLGKSGKPSTVYILGDYSDGNDAILSADATVTTVQALKGRTIHMELSTVSNYATWRALQIFGMKYSDVNLAQLGETEIEPSITNSKNTGVMFVTTWNPIVMNIMKNPAGITNVFNSHQIPGEILDLLVVKDESVQTNYQKRCVMALVGAWYDVMRILEKKSSPEAIVAKKFMAGQSACSLGEYEQQLKTTYLYYTPESAYDYMMSDKFGEVLSLVYRFTVESRLMGRTVKDMNYLGIRLPNGKVIGNPDKVLVTYDPTYTQMAAEGTLIAVGKRLK
jgi:NitT/TauT family transport system substrate-binding protein